MRALGVLFLIPALLVGAEGIDVHALLEELGSGSAARRRAAYALLARRGEEIAYLLEKARSDDPEVCRRLDGLRDIAGRVRIEAVPLRAEQPLGDAVVVQVTLVNGTLRSWQLPLVCSPSQGAGTFSTFVVERPGHDARFLRPDAVDAGAAVEGSLLRLSPGARVVVRIRLEGESSPLRAPGSCEFSIGYLGNAEKGSGWGRASEGEIWDLRLRSDALVVRGVACTPEQLESALESGDPLRRASALAELEIREDEGVLPVLRRHLRDPDLRLAAVRRLGAAAQEHDFALIVEATSSPSAQVRLAAVEALGHFRSDRARRKLLRFTHDFELQEAAVRALRAHRSAHTIERFIRILPTASEPVSAEIRRMLFEWTGQVVDGRLSEIQAFERWWGANRERWAQEDRRRR